MELKSNSIRLLHTGPFQFYLNSKQQQAAIVLDFSVAPNTFQSTSQETLEKNMLKAWEAALGLDTAGSQQSEGLLSEADDKEYLENETYELFVDQTYATSSAGDEVESQAISVEYLEEEATSEVNVKSTKKGRICNNFCLLCRKKYSEEQSISLHRFPRNPIMCSAWKQLCGIQDRPIKGHERICNRHFPTMFAKTLHGTAFGRMMNSALPIFDVPNAHLITKIKTEIELKKGIKFQEYNRLEEMIESPEMFRVLDEATHTSKAHKGQGRKRAVEYCRLCLEQSDTLSETVWAADAQLAMKYLKIECRWNDEEYLPWSICSRCSKSLNAFDSFYTNCLKKQELLLAFMQRRANKNDAQLTKENLLLGEARVKSNLKLYTARKTPQHAAGTDKSLSTINIQETSNKSPEMQEETASLEVREESPFVENEIEIPYTQLGVQSSLERLIDDNSLEHIEEGSYLKRMVAEICLENASLDRNENESSNEWVIGPPRDNEDAWVIKPPPAHAQAEDEDEGSSDEDEVTDEDEDELIYRCYKCSRDFPSKVKLDDHNYIYHADKELKPDPKVPCDHCGRIFPMSRVKYHIARMHQVKNYTCNLCGRQYGTSTFLKAHIRASHAGSGPCPICGKVLTRRGLDAHRPRCGKVESIACELCPMTLTSYSHYLRHKRKVHEEKGIFMCGFCGKDCGRKETLVEHEAMHRGEQRWACSYCPKKFTFRTNYYTHCLKAHRAEYKKAQAKKEWAREKRLLENQLIVDRSKVDEMTDGEGGIMEANRENVTYDANFWNQ